MNLVLCKVACFFKMKIPTFCIILNDVEYSILIGSAKSWNFFVYFRDDVGTVDFSNLLLA